MSSERAAAASVQTTAELLPTVTAVVPTHLRPEPLRRAVRAIVGQDYPGKIDVVVVFDKSEPTPLDLDLPPARDVVYVANTRNSGLAGARNTGILAATGDLIGFCDDDDEWRPGKISAQVDLLGRFAATEVVGCHVSLDGEHGPIGRARQAEVVDLNALLRSRVFELHPSTVLVRREAVIDGIGLVDEEIPGGYGEDYDWLLRAAKRQPIRLVPEPMVQVTWQTGSQFSGRWQMISDADQYLLRKHPEFTASKAGIARLEGQIAFAEAAQGRRREAGQWARRALAHDPRERRAYLALAISTRLVSTDKVVAMAHRRGRGI
jgi:glycosyltransferase involved in cell wall biosynthesis